MKTRASLRISGNVQMVGFRTFNKQDEAIGAIGGVSERIAQNKDEIVMEISFLHCYRVDFPSCHSQALIPCLS